MPWSTSKATASGHGMLVQALNLAEGLPSDLTPHRATYDALVTARLFCRLPA
jgi:hypothetical protein